MCPCVTMEFVTNVSALKLLATVKFLVQGSIIWQKSFSNTVEVGLFTFGLLTCI